MEREQSPYALPEPHRPEQIHRGDRKESSGMRKAFEIPIKRTGETQGRPYRRRNVERI